MVGDAAKRDRRFGQRRLRPNILILFLHSNTQFGTRAQKSGLRSRDADLEFLGYGRHGQLFNIAEQNEFAQQWGNMSNLCS